MRVIIAALYLIACAVAVQPASARNVPYFLDLEEVFGSQAFAERVGHSVTFVFGDREVSVEKTFEEYVVHERQHFKGRSDEATCRDTLIRALEELKEHAEDNDANAVIGIVSYFRRKTFSSTTVFECHAGSSGVFVSLKGTVANIAK